VSSLTKSGRITPTNDDGSAVLASLDGSVEQRLGSASELLKLENTGRAVPEDRLSGSDSLGVQLLRLGPGVESHPPVRDTRLVGGSRGLQNQEDGTSVSSVSPYEQPLPD
jgi:hypothetical protein